MTALKDLLAKVESGDNSRVNRCVSDLASSARDVGKYFPGHEIVKAYYGSLDAAKALHDAVLPGWDLQICTYEDDLFEVSVSLPLCVKTYDGLSEIIARAWLIAIIRALIAQEEGV